MNSEEILRHGCRHPYDASDSWWEGRGKSYEFGSEFEKDWAKRAARGVLSDLQGRHKIKDGFGGIPEDSRKEIVETMAAIIREASAQARPVADRLISAEDDISSLLQCIAELRVHLRAIEMDIEACRSRIGAIASNSNKRKAI